MDFQKGPFVFPATGILLSLTASTSRSLANEPLPSVYPWVPTPIPQALDALLGPQLHPAPRLMGK